MVRRTSLPSRRPRLAAAATLALTVVATGASAGIPAAAAGQARSADATADILPAVSKASTASISIVSSAPKIVSSTGHRLRVKLLAFRASTGSQIEIAALTRDQGEEHDWSFKVPDSAVSISTKGTGRIHLTSKRSGGYAIVSLKASPHGTPTHTSCQGKTATRTRHVSLSGTLLLHTRSTGKHAWGQLGRAHPTMHFSTRSKVTWVKRVASNCPAPTIACGSTFAWQASGGPPDEFAILTSANKGAHAEIGGLRSVSLPEPSGATRSDIVSLPQSSSNQLIVNPDGSATMQATYRGGTATLTALQPAITQVEPCGAGKKKVSVEYWSSDFVNGPVPIRVPAQVFGGFSMPDTPAAAIYRITLMH